MVPVDIVVSVSATNEVHTCDWEAESTRVNDMTGRSLLSFGCV
jgi:hypothetical protein